MNDGSVNDSSEERGSVLYTFVVYTVLPSSTKMMAVRINDDSATHYLFYPAPSIWPLCVALHACSCLIFIRTFKPFNVLMLLNDHELNLC